MSDADVELARVTARRRMIGMAVLVLVGVVGFPWLFETQPRPMTGEVQVLSANSTAPVVLPVQRAAVSGRVLTAPSPEAEMVELPEPSPTSSTVASSPSAGAKVDAASQRASAPLVSDAASKAAAAKAKAEAKAKADAKAHAEAKTKAEEKAHEDKLKAQAKAKADEKARQEAKLKADEKAKGKDAVKDTAKAKPDPKTEAKVDPKADAKASGDTRYIVQVGAFSDTNTAQAARAKVEKLGIKTYTQEVNTPTGKKIRVRVGPYANKAEADKAMASLKKAGLVAAVLTL
jgi:DedD protein